MRGFLPLSRLPPAVLSDRHCIYVELGYPEPLILSCIAGLGCLVDNRDRVRSSKAHLDVMYCIVL